MKNYNVTVNGKTYEVSVEEAAGGAVVQSVQAQPVQQPKAAPAPAAPKAAAPAPAAAPKAAAGGTGDVKAPLMGTVLSVAVSEGDQVKAGQILMIFEAMKMENEIVAPAAGTVKKVHVSAGTVLEIGQVVMTIE